MCPSRARTQPTHPLHASACVCVRVCAFLTPTVADLYARVRVWVYVCTRVCVGVCVHVCTHVCVWVCVSQMSARHGVLRVSHVGDRVLISGQAVTVLAGTVCAAACPVPAGAGGGASAGAGAGAGAGEA